MKIGANQNKEQIACNLFKSFNNQRNIDLNSSKLMQNKRCTVNKLSISKIVGVSVIDTNISTQK